MLFSLPKVEKVLCDDADGGDDDDDDDADVDGGDQTGDCKDLTFLTIKGGARRLASE